MEETYRQTWARQESVPIFKEGQARGFALVQVKQELNDDSMEVMDRAKRAAEGAEIHSVEEQASPQESRRRLQPEATIINAPRANPCV